MRGAMGSDMQSSDLRARPQRLALPLWQERYASPALPMSWSEMAARMGRGRYRVRYRRRLRGPPELRDGDPRPRAGKGGLPRCHPQPAGLALAAPMAAVWPPPALLRHQRRQHGLADQPLHCQPQAPQRRRLFARRAHRPASGPGHAPLLPPGPRSLLGCPHHRGRSRGLAPPAGSLRLLERYRPTVHPSSIARPTSSSMAWAKTPS